MAYNINKDKKQKEMLRIEFVRYLEKLRLNQAEFARITGSDTKSVWRWKTGERAIPPKVEKFISILSLLDDRTIQSLKHSVRNVSLSPEEILGVKRYDPYRDNLDEWKLECKKKWRALTKLYHSDINKGGDEDLKLINNSYDKLKAKQG